MPDRSVPSSDFVLDSSFRGVPPGEHRLLASEIAGRGWLPADGRMSLPLLSIDLPTFEDNTSTMLHIASTFGAEIAPHAKTPMSPRLAHGLVAAGAWGTSVADIRQASVMLDNGLQRLLIANEIGGLYAARRLAALLQSHAEAQVYLFVDSVALLDSLKTVWAEGPTLPALSLLLEVGCGRGGVLSHTEFLSLLERAKDLGDPRLRVAGVACYEGTANRPDAADMLRTMGDLFDRTRLAIAAVRSALGADKPLLLSAGGSSFFDYVIKELGPLPASDPKLTLLLRSGACFFSDSGPIRQRLLAIADRELLGQDVSKRIVDSFAPSLRLWAEVLSRNVEGTAICGIGLRDASHDQGLPVPLRLWRDGKPAQSLVGDARLAKLNDQHGFLECEDIDVQVGDVVEFGVQHPCTCLDKHHVIFVLDHRGAVIDAYQTFFG